MRSRQSSGGVAAVSALDLLNPCQPLEYLVNVYLVVLSLAAVAFELPSPRAGPYRMWVGRW